MRCANPKCGLLIPSVPRNRRFCDDRCKAQYHRSTPEYRLYMRAYQKSAPARRAQAKYRKSPKRKASVRKCLASAKFRQGRKAYRLTAAYKAGLRKYSRSAKAKAAARRYRQGAAYAEQKAKRRARYHADPEYRECTKKRAESHKRKRSTEKLLAQLARLAAELQSKGPGSEAPSKPKSRR